MWKLVLFKVALYTLGRLPLPLLYGLVGLLAGLIYFLSPKARHNVWGNLRHVMPADASRKQMRAAARRVFRNVTLYYADLVRMPRLDVGDFRRRHFVYHGFQENLLPAIEAGRGVILLGAHCGNAELAVQGLIPEGIRVLALTEPLKPPGLSRLVDSLRSSKGHTFLPVSVSSVKRAVRTLRNGGVVALMGDRDIQGPKALLPFCGVETLMPTGPIEMALRTGAIVIPAFSARRDKYTIEAYVEEPLAIPSTGDRQQDVRVGSLRFLERLERHLRTDPAQWAVLEAVWEAPAPPLPQPASAAGTKA